MKNSSPTAVALEQIEIHWGPRRILAELRRTTRRVLRLKVRPSGEVIVFAPSGEELVKIQERVNRRRPWIFRKIDQVLNWPARTPERHFVSGETHLLLGKQYRLSIEQSQHTDVRIEGAWLKVCACRIDDPVLCWRLVREFYGAMAHGVFLERLHLVSPPFIRRGMQMPALVIRQMSKRWGSYTPAGRIILNLDLVRASPLLIDYVICHELSHAFHSDHGKEWRSLLSTIMPDWESRKAHLETLLR